MNKFKQSIFFALCLLNGFLASPSVIAEPKDRASWQEGVIEGALRFNPHLQVQGLQVLIDGHQADISGFVDSKLSRALAEQMTLNVRGIDAVVNRLVIAPNKFNQTLTPTSSEHNDLSNVTISNKVKSQLLANRLTNGMKVDVETRNRVVLITGYVNSSTEKELTYWVVKNTIGVKKVVDQLEIATDINRQARIELTE